MRIQAIDDLFAECFQAFQILDAFDDSSSPSILLFKNTGSAVPELTVTSKKLGQLSESERRRTWDGSVVKRDGLKADSKSDASVVTILTALDSLACSASLSAASTQRLNMDHQGRMMRAKTPDRTPDRTPMGTPSKVDQGTDKLSLMDQQSQPNIYVNSDDVPAGAPTPRIGSSVQKATWDEEPRMGNIVGSRPPRHVREPSLSHCLESANIAQCNDQGGLLTACHTPGQLSKAAHTQQFSPSQMPPEQKQRRASFVANRLFTVALSRATGGADRIADADTATMDTVGRRHYESQKALPHPASDQSDVIALSDQV